MQFGHASSIGMTNPQHPEVPDMGRTAERGDETPTGETGRVSLRRAGPVVWKTVLGIALMLGALEGVQIFISERAQGAALSLGQLASPVLTWLWLAALVWPVVWLVRRVPPGRSSAWWGIPAHITAAIAFTIAHLSGSAALHVIAHPEVAFRDALAFQFGFYFTVDLLVYAAIAGGYLALLYHADSIERERVEARLEASLSEARLDALRAQLNPHFLFNTLNTISTLALENDDRSVADAIGRLGDLLRATLEGDGSQEILLDRELDLLDSFLAIQKARFADRLTVEQSIDPDARRALVPPLVLQPLVENAVTHGIGAIEGPGWIRVSADRENGRLALIVEDSGPGFPKEAPRPDAVGLANTRARLTELYGPDATLSFGDAVDTEGGRVEIHLPFRTREGQ